MFRCGRHRSPPVSRRTRPIPRRARLPGSSKASTVVPAAASGSGPASGWAAAKLSLAGGCSSLIARRNAPDPRRSPRRRSDDRTGGTHAHATPQAAAVVVYCNAREYRRAYCRCRRRGPCRSRCRTCRTGRPWRWWTPREPDRSAPALVDERLVRLERRSRYWSRAPRWARLSVAAQRQTHRSAEPPPPPPEPRPARPPHTRPPPRELAMRADAESSNISTSPRVCRHPLL